MTYALRLLLPGVLGTGALFLALLVLPLSSVAQTNDAETPATTATESEVSIGSIESTASPDVVAVAESEDHQALPTLHYFYSPTCRFCQAMDEFFRTELMPAYPALVIERYNVTRPGVAEPLSALIEQHPDARQYQGVVPLTFFGDRFFVGFNDDVARNISALVGEAYALRPPQSDDEVAGERDDISEDADETEQGTQFTVPFLGTIDAGNYSTAALAALLGFLDGFNICSLGALMLILSLVVKLRSRSLVLLYGGMFIGVTAAMYMLLILIWHQVFLTVSPFISALELVVGLIALAGGVYFFREYVRFEKYGLTCESGSNRLVAAVSDRVGKAFAGGTRWGIVGAVALFAAVVVVIEFPCSAAIPVTFAGMLALMDLSVASYVGYIAIFMLFYLLDEIIIFLIAVYSLKLWATKGSMVKYATLATAFILFGFGVYYVLSVF